MGGDGQRCFVARFRWNGLLRRRLMGFGAVWRRIVPVAARRSVFPRRALHGSHKAAHLLLLFPLDLSEGHCQHDDQRQVHAQAHLGQSRDGVVLETKGHVEPAVDALDGAALAVVTLPLIC